MSVLMLLIIGMIVVAGVMVLALTGAGKGKSAVLPLCVGGVVLVIFAVRFLSLGVDFAFLLFVIPGFIIVGLIVFAIVKSGKGGLIVAGSIVGLLVLLAVGALFFTLARSTMQVRQAESIQQAMTAEVSSAVWHEGVEREFVANVYPSKRAAAGAMDKRLVVVLHDVAGEDHGKISVLAGSVEKTYVKEMTKTLGGLAGRFLAEGEEGGDVVVELALVDGESVDAPWSAGGDKKVESGRFEATVRSGDESLTVSTSFVEKPWVENFSEFLNRNQDRQLLLVRSSDTCTSEAQAHQQTLRDACNRVSNILRGMQADPSILPAKLDVSEGELSSAGLIVDRFTQRFSGMAGPIWREAILVDTSEAKLSSLAQKKIVVSRVKRKSWFRTVGTLVGMFLLICIVYMFLNAATRGYYSWTLRIALVVLMCVGVFLVLMLV